MYCPSFIETPGYVDGNHDFYFSDCKTLSNFIPLMVSTPQQPPLQNPRKKWFLQHPISMLTLSIVITVIVIAGLIYPLRSGPIDTETPRGKLDFNEGGWTLTGSFIELTENVSLKDAAMSITDASLGLSASTGPLEDGAIAQVPHGLNATYSDINKNEQIERYDTIRVLNYDSGDIVTFIYLPTGGIITSYTVPG